MSREDYTVGQQPCDAFTPAEPRNNRGPSSTRASFFREKTMDIYSHIHIMPNKQVNLDVEIEDGRRLTIRAPGGRVDFTITFASPDELRAFVARIAAALD